jgi:AcrR family transcriptional regulator
MLQPKVHESGRRIRNSLSQAEIIQGALEILKEQGGEALTVRQIAKQLHCSVSALYSHFRNYDEILNAMVADTEARLARELRKARLGFVNTIDQLIAVARTYWAFALDNPDMHRLMYRQTRYLRVPPAYRVYLDTFRRGFRTGDLQYSRHEAQALARTMFAWLYGLITMELLGVAHIAQHGGRQLEDGLRHFHRLMSHGHKFEAET